MPQQISLPVTLTDNEFVVVKCDRATKQLTAHIPSKDSYDLGNYWRAHEKAIPYLRMAFGGDKELAEQAVTTAYNFGEAVVELHESPKRVYAATVESRAKNEMKALRQVEDLKDVLDDGEDAMVDPIAERQKRSRA